MINGSFISNRWVRKTVNAKHGTGQKKQNKYWRHRSAYSKEHFSEKLAVFEQLLLSLHCKLAIQNVEGNIGSWKTNEEDTAVLPWWHGQVRPSENEQQR